MSKKQQFIKFLLNTQNVKLTPYQKVLYGHLVTQCNYIKNTGYIRAYSELQEDTEIKTKTTLIEAVKVLERACLIQVKHGERVEGGARNQRNIYYLPTAIKGKSLKQVQTEFQKKQNQINFAKNLLKQEGYEVHRT